MFRLFVLWRYINNQSKGFYVLLAELIMKKLPNASIVPNTNNKLATSPHFYGLGCH